MTVLPSSLALTTIADGSNIVAADHRNNYTAAQTAVNALIAALGAGAAGQVLNGAGTTVSWGYPPGYELAYTEFTGDVTSTVTTAATAVSVASTTVTLDGSAVWVEFYAPSSLHSVASVAGTWDVWDGSTDLGVIAQEVLQASVGYSVSVRRKIAAPSAGSHTFSIRQWCATAGTLTTKAGSGGPGNYLPGFIRIVKA